MSKIDEQALSEHVLDILMSKDGPDYRGEIASILGMVRRLDERLRDAEKRIAELEAVVAKDFWEKD